jgi:hypothetical protein
MLRSSGAQGARGVAPGAEWRGHIDVVEGHYSIHDPIYICMTTYPAKLYHEFVIQYRNRPVPIQSVSACLRESIND